MTFPPSSPFSLITLVSLLFQGGGVFAESPTLKIAVDARELNRKLIHVRMEIPASPGECSIWFPKWIPGTHSPVGPVDKIAGLHFRTPDGAEIPWHRTSDEPWRFLLQTPPATTRVVAEMDCVADGGVFPANGVGCYGSSSIGIIPWNAVLLYPEKESTDTLPCALTLQLPQDWKWGSALQAVATHDSVIVFETNTVSHLVDSPLICGRNFETFDLSGAATPPVFLHVTSESSTATRLDSALLDAYRKLVDEALSLFGGAHFKEYHFLLVLSDKVDGVGLEHLCSSLNITTEQAYADANERKHSSHFDLLPHEFVHSWCGKYRRPVGMCLPGFHHPLQTPLLWVYEGLTTHLGELLTVRCGLQAQEDHWAGMASAWEGLSAMSGRSWRSLEDTATVTSITWGASRTWGLLRRHADYYPEGLTIWLEVDSILRNATHGKINLDDFCRKFLGHQEGHDGPVYGYDLTEMETILNELAPRDWHAFFMDRVIQPRTNLNLAFVKDLGWRLQYVPKPTERGPRRAGGTDLISSIGLSVDDGGKITSVVPGSPGDKAGLAPDMQLVGVNDRKFSGQRLKDAVADSVVRHSVDLLLLDGEIFRTVPISYSGGSRYLELVRDSDQPDLLTAIFTPIAGKSK